MTDFERCGYLGGHGYTCVSEKGHEGDHTWGTGAEIKRRPRSDDCPFCDYQGPSEIIQDYGSVYVIVPIDPVTEGHVLVIPKRHVEDASIDAHLTGFAFAMAVAYAKEQKLESFNLITSKGEAATQTVKHLHVHVVPRREGDGLALPWT